VRRLLSLAFALIAWSVDVPPAWAQATLIRDAEIERTLHRVAWPIFRSAGLTPISVDIHLVADEELNAFVAGGRDLFLNTGLVIELDDLDALRWVIAHETGHIAGGHLARRGEALRGARGTAVIGMLGAAAATVAGSPEAGFAIASTSGQVAQRTALAHSRAEEASADQAGLRYYAASGGDPEAVLDVLERFRGQEALSRRRQDAYAQTHPLWSDRIAMLETRLAELPTPPEPDPDDLYWHARMVAKLDGFLSRPGEVLRDYPEDSGEPALLARAVAYHRAPNPDRAIAAVDALIAARPGDPYYHELRGQFLLEIGQATDAAAAYRRAAELKPKASLILAGLGRALLNTGSHADTAEARDALARATERDRNNPGALRDLALAEARLGNDGAAALATAERFAVERSPADALRHADRAAALLPPGSPGWRRAQDVIRQARRALN